MKGLKRSIVCTMMALMLFANSISVSAQEAVDAETQYISMIVERLEKDGEINAEKVVSAEVIAINSSSNSEVVKLCSVENEDNSTLEGVKISLEEDNEITEMYVIPFYDSSDTMVNAARSSTLSPSFQDSQYGYVLVTAVYYYYSAAETDWAGPYYRPTLLKAKWSDSTSTKSAKKLYAKFTNASHVVDLSTNDAGDIVSKSSVVSVSNPSNGITTYSYIYGYVTDSSSNKHEFSFEVFDGSGLNSGY